MSCRYRTVLTWWDCTNILSRAFYFSQVLSEVNKALLLPSPVPALSFSRAFISCVLFLLEYLFHCSAASEWLSNDPSRWWFEMRGAAPEWSEGRGFAPSEREEERCPTFDNDTRNEGDSGGASNTGCLWFKQPIVIWKINQLSVRKLSWSLLSNERYVQSLVLVQFGPYWQWP